MITEFSSAQALLGGALIGLATIALMAFVGRVAGVSGILMSLLPDTPVPKRLWRITFIVGMFGSGIVLKSIFGFAPSYEVISTPLVTLVSGLIVGVGVGFASGSTCGHGVCGLAQLSRRSMIATLLFMTSMSLTVLLFSRF